jgi:hypothetical protein
MTCSSLKIFNAFSSRLLLAAFSTGIRLIATFISPQTPSKTVPKPPSPKIFARSIFNLLTNELGLTEVEIWDKLKMKKAGKN